MHQQELNITSVQKNLPQLMDSIVRGNEIIITESNVPIAKISPIKDENVSFTNHFLKARSIETKRSAFSDSPENWFG